MEVDPGVRAATVAGVTAGMATGAAVVGTGLAGVVTGRVAVAAAAATGTGGVVTGAVVAAAGAVVAAVMAAATLGRCINFCIHAPVLPCRICCSASSGGVMESIDWVRLFAASTDALKSLSNGLYSFGGCLGCSGCS